MRTGREKNRERLGSDLEASLELLCQRQLVDYLRNFLVRVSCRLVVANKPLGGI